MSQNYTNPDLIIKQKKGLPVYKANPSIPEASSITKNTRVRVGNDKRGFIVDNGSGELLSVGGVGFYEFEEVDNAKFVKLFLAGLKQATGLSKAGLDLFGLVYKQIQETPNNDEVKMSYYLASEAIKDLQERTYQRGLRELLKNEFLFNSPVDGVFYINIRYMFNGDRLAFVKGYQRKSSAKKENQLDMFEQKALEAKEAEAE